jgi:hypothetical protein
MKPLLAITMNMGSRLSNSMLLLACLATGGCSQAPSMGDVRGTVTLDGTPVAEGSIRFEPINGQTGTAGGFIKDGKFETRVPIATHRVEISAVKAPPGIKVDRHNKIEYTVVQLIPEKYNSKSTLTLEVKAGLTEKAFDLKTR